MTSYRLHVSLGYNLSLAARLQERRLDDALRSLGLTRTTWCVLLAVGVEGHAQPSDIATFIGIDRTATSRALRAMEAAGLLTRQSGKGDRRTTRVTLTPLGLERIRQGVPFAVENNALMQAKLTDAEYDQLLHLLAKLTEGESTDLSTF
ncbi:MAG: MarR family transcriptional regulator [Silicimonas sp.]